MSNKFEEIIKEAKKVNLTNQERSSSREEMVLFITEHPERKNASYRHYYWGSILALSLASILLVVVNVRVLEKPTDSGLKLETPVVATEKDNLSASSSSEKIILIKRAEQATEGVSAEINQLDKKNKNNE